MLLSICSCHLLLKACNVWSQIEHDTGLSQGFVECCWQLMRDEPKTILIRRLDILTCGFQEMQSAFFDGAEIDNNDDGTALFALGIPAIEVLLN